MASLFAQSQRHYSVTACETTCVFELLLVPKDSLVRKTIQTNDLYKDIYDKKTELSKQLTE